ncbi:hypothetical protein IWQ60_010782, partial [Tieghemiomyces parasiticus]
MPPTLSWTNILFRRDDGPSAFFRCALPSGGPGVAYFDEPFDLHVPNGTTAGGLHLFFTIQDSRRRDSGGPMPRRSQPLHLFYVELEQNHVTGAETRLTIDLGHYGPTPTLAETESPGSSDSEWVHIAEASSKPDLPPQREQAYVCEVAWTFPVGGGGSDPSSSLFKRCQVVDGDGGRVLLDVTYRLLFGDTLCPGESTTSPCLPRAVTGPPTDPIVPASFSSIPLVNRTPTDTMESVSNGTVKSRSWLRKTRSVVMGNLRHRRTEATLVDGSLGTPGETSSPTAPHTPTRRGIGIADPAQPTEIERRYYDWPLLAAPSKHRRRVSRSPSHASSSRSGSRKGLPSSADDWEEVSPQLQFVPGPADAAGNPTMQVVIPALAMDTGAGSGTPTSSAAKPDLINKLGHWLYNTSPVQYFKKADYRKRVKDRFATIEPIIMRGSRYDLRECPPPPLVLPPPLAAAPDEVSCSGTPPVFPQRQRRSSFSITRHLRPRRTPPTTPVLADRPLLPLEAASLPASPIDLRPSPLNTAREMAFPSLPPQQAAVVDATNSDPLVGRRRSSTWTWPRNPRIISESPTPLPQTLPGAQALPIRPPIERRRSRPVGLTILTALLGNRQNTPEAHATPPHLPSQPSPLTGHYGAVPRSATHPAGLTLSPMASPTVDPDRQFRRTDLMGEGGSGRRPRRLSRPTNDLSSRLMDVALADNIPVATAPPIASRRDSLSNVFLGEARSPDGPITSRSPPVLARIPVHVSQGWFCAPPAPLHPVDDTVLEPPLTTESAARHARRFTAQTDIIRRLGVALADRGLTVVRSSNCGLTVRHVTTLDVWPSSRGIGYRRHSDLPGHTVVHLTLHLAVTPAMTTLDEEELRFAPRHLNGYTTAKPSHVVRLALVPGSSDPVTGYTLDCTAEALYLTGSQAAPLAVELAWSHLLDPVEDLVNTLRADWEALVLDHWTGSQVTDADLAESRLIRHVLYHAQSANYFRRPYFSNAGAFVPTLAHAIHQAMATHRQSPRLLKPPTSPAIDAVYRDRLRNRRPVSQIPDFSNPTPRRWEPVPAGTLRFPSCASFFDRALGVRSMVSTQDAVRLAALRSPHGATEPTASPGGPSAPTHAVRPNWLPPDFDAFHQLATLMVDSDEPLSLASTTPPPSSHRGTNGLGTDTANPPASSSVFLLKRPSDHEPVALGQRTLQDFFADFEASFYFSYETDFPPLPTNPGDVQACLADLRRADAITPASPGPEGRWLDTSEEEPASISSQPPSTPPSSSSSVATDRRGDIALSSPPAAIDGGNFLSSYTSDSGWGCMHRTGQMMLAGGFSNVLLGPGWRPSCNGTADQHGAYHRILGWFASNYGPHAHYAIQRMSLEGTQSPFNVPVGSWFSPSVVAHVLKRLSTAHTDCPVRVEVATDQLVHPDRVLDHLPASPRTQLLGRERGRPVILFIPVRLGIDRLNPLYIPNLKHLLGQQQCLGIVGGQPSRSFYFVGFQGDEIFYLDPHLPHPYVATTAARNATCPTPPYHPDAVHSCRFTDLDPSMLLGFVFTSSPEFCH